MGKLFSSSNTLQFKRLHPDAVIPSRAHTTDAGFDLTAVESDCYPLEGDGAIKWIITYKTGIAVAIPFGFVGLLVPRSSVTKTGLSLTNCCGIIDSGYRGELIVNFYDLCQTSKIYSKGDRVGQLIIVPILTAAEEVDILPESDRGLNGFGSTGR